MSAVPADVADALQRRDWAQVEALCRPVLASMPATPWACAALVQACSAQGREAEVDQLLVKAVPWAGRESFAAAALRERLIADGELERLASLLPEAPLAEDAIEERVLAAAHAHRRSDYAGAIRLARATLEREPKHAAALNHQARATHNLGREAEALTLFEAAVTADPRYPEAWHNLALARRAAGQFEPALAAYLRAIALRPGFRSATLNFAKTLLALDRPAQGLTTLQAWLVRHPDDVDARLHEGLCLHALQRLDEALASYRRALALDPDNGLVALYLGTLHNQRMERAEAGEMLLRAVQRMPRDGDAWSELAAWHELENRLDEGADAVTRGLAVAPRHPRLLLEAARFERRRGRSETALQRLKALPPKALAPRQRAAYWFEFARNLDRLRAPREAFAAYAEANRNARQFGSEALAAEFEQQLARLEAWPPDTEATPWTMRPLMRAPAFLLGFPRSGITLLNTMLGCHDGLATLEEKPTVEACAARLAQHPLGYPACLDSLSEDEVEMLRALYWKTAATYLGPDDRRPLLDTFPLRTLHVALIARLFPDARVIFMRRHPADVVLSNFMQEYTLNGANLAFTDLTDTAALFARTQRIFERARARLPLRVHVLRYEDLVREPRPTLETALAFLGLPWRDNVLHGHVARAREVRISTSSYHQVAEPLYDRSIGRWEAYRAQLEPVLPQLAEVARQWGYAL